MINSGQVRMICEGKAVQKGSFAVITQKCNKTANINVKKTAVYTHVNGE